MERMTRFEMQPVIEEEVKVSVCKCVCLMQSVIEE